ncbi:MAG TPA: DUF493 domain-containing protein [Desulfuromonadales bacterium]|nr:DUF493 domain-containing protein [Desulfuromonadales bacterium]
MSEISEHHHNLEELLEFPCDHIFKAFGLNDPTERFVEAVRSAVSATVPVPLDALKTRASGEGTYVCVSIVVRLYNFNQLKKIYATLQQVAGLKYLL